MRWKWLGCLAVRSVGRHGCRIRQGRFQWLRYSSRLGLEPLADFWNRGTRDLFSSSNQRGGVFEGVILVTVHIRLNYQVGRLFPDVAIHLLRNRETLPDDIKQMPRPF